MNLSRAIFEENDFFRLTQLLPQCKGQVVNFTPNDPFTLAKLCEVYRINNTKFLHPPPDPKVLFESLKKFVSLGEVKTRDLIYHLYIVSYSDDKKDVKSDPFFTQHLFIKRLFGYWISNNPQLLSNLTSFYYLIKQRVNMETDTLVTVLFLWNIIMEWNFKLKKCVNNTEWEECAIQKIMSDAGNHSKNWMIIVTESIYRLNWGVFTKFIKDHCDFHPNILTSCFPWVQHRLRHHKEDRDRLELMTKLCFIVRKHPQLIRVAIPSFRELSNQERVGLTTQLKEILMVMLNENKKIHRTDFENLFVLLISVNGGPFVSLNETLLIISKSNLLDINNLNLFKFFADQMWVCYQMTKIITEEEKCVSTLLEFLLPNVTKIIQTGNIAILEEMLHLVIIFKCKSNNVNLMQFLFEIIQVSSKTNVIDMGSLLQLILFCCQKFPDESLHNICKSMCLLKSGKEVVETCSLFLLLHGIDKFKNLIGNTYLQCFSNVEVYSQITHKLKLKVVLQAFQLLFNKKPQMYHQIKSQEKLTKHIQFFYCGIN